MEYTDFFNGELHKFSKEDSLLKSLPIESKMILTELGFPKIIRGQKYNLYDQVKMDSTGQYILIGNDHYIENYFLALKNETWELVLLFQENIESDMRISLYNSSVLQLVITLILEEFIVSYAVKHKIMGNYYPDNHVKYSELLRKLILVVDPQSTEEGAWAGVIEEMHLGVI